MWHECIESDYEYRVVYVIQGERSTARELFLWKLSVRSKVNSPLKTSFNFWNPCWPLEPLLWSVNGYALMMAGFYFGMAWSPKGFKGKTPREWTNREQIRTLKSAESSNFPGLQLINYEFIKKPLYDQGNPWARLVAGNNSNPCERVQDVHGLERLLISGHWLYSPTSPESFQQKQYV